jgi:nucleoside-diphosphate-sugar epimerase
MRLGSQIGWRQGEVPALAKKTALIVGASGIVGGNLAGHLVSQADRWSVYGLARKPAVIEGVQSISTDLLKPEMLKQALAAVKPTHIFPLHLDASTDRGGEYPRQ